MAGTRRNTEYRSMPKDRRRSPRHQLGRVAAIMFGQGKEHSCLVKDFSDGGVRLQLNGFEIPDEFALLFAPNELARSGHYKVVWRLGKDVGAKFIGPRRNTLDGIL
jgi:PilZ domain